MVCVRRQRDMSDDGMIINRQVVGGQPDDLALHRVDAIYAVREYLEPIGSSQSTTGWSHPQP